MSRSATPATAVSYPQIDLEEVTRRRLHESLWSAPDQGGLHVDDTTLSRMSHVKCLIESRPPGLKGSRSSPPQPNQPPLDLTDQEADDAARRVGPPNNEPDYPMPGSGVPHLLWP
jgi:hypothetical protein